MSSSILEKLLVSRGKGRTKKDKFLPILIRAARQSALLGWNDMIDEYVPKVAKKSGALRLAFREVGLEIINSQRNAVQIRFSVSEIYSRLVAKLDYAEHHLEVGPTGKSFYINPTTPGTEPIKSKIFMPILAAKTQMHFTEELKRAGLIVRSRK